MEKLYASLIFFWFFTSSNCYCQVNEFFCPIDVMQDFTLVVKVFNEGDDFKHYFELSYTKPNYSSIFSKKDIKNFGEFLEFVWDMPFGDVADCRHCSPYYGKYYKSDNSFETYTSYTAIYDENGDIVSNTPLDTVYFRLPKHRLKALEIIFIHRLEESKVVDISAMNFLKEINLEQFETISIEQNSFGHPCSYILNLDQWPGYAEAVQKNVLSELILSHYIFDNHFSDKIKPFTNLRKLIAPSISIDIDPQHFTKAESPFQVYSHYFDLRVFQYPNLVRYDLNPYGEPDFHFFTSNANIKLTGHPLHIFYSLIQKRLNVNPLKSGIVYLTEKQLDTNSDTNFLSDNIIAQGQIENGTPVGVWKFDISSPFIKYLQKHCGEDHDCYDNLSSIDHLDLKEFRYDYSKPQSTNFPENGAWKFYYANGTLAIEGQFENFKKNGIWKFYKPDGKEINLTTYINDKAIGLQIVYYYSGNEIIETRCYNFDECTSIESMRETKYNDKTNKWEYTGKIVFYERNWCFNFEKYSGYRFNINSDLEYFEEDILIYTYKKGSPEYDKILRENFLNLLYPDYEVGKTPYDLMEE
jgi:hypothetical protein